MSGRSATRDHVNQLSHGELINPAQKTFEVDPMLSNVRTSLHTTVLKPDPTPSTDPELFDKSTGHPNSHYDHSKTLSKKKRAKMYGTSSPELTSRPATVKVDRSNVLDDHDAHEKVDHNKARDDMKQAAAQGVPTSKLRDATSGREDEDLITKRDEVSQADKPDVARKDHTVTTSDANKKKFAEQQKQDKSSDKSSDKPSSDKSDKSSDKSDKADKSDKSDKSSDKSDDSSEKGMLGRAADRAANLASGLLGSVKDAMSSVTGKSEETSSDDARQQAAKEQEA